MVMSKREQTALLQIIDEMEKTAQTQPEHSPTRSAIFRQAAALRSLLRNSVVTRDGRADGQPC